MRKKEACGVEVNESEGGKACLKRRLISLHESFRIFFRRRRFLFSFGPPIRQSDVVAGEFPPHYTGNVCISVYRLNIYEAFRCQEDSIRRRRSTHRVLLFHFTLFRRMLLLISPLVAFALARTTLRRFFYRELKEKE